MSEWNQPMGWLVWGVELAVLMGLLPSLRYRHGLPSSGAGFVDRKAGEARRGCEEWLARNYEIEPPPVAEPLALLPPGRDASGEQLNMVDQWRLLDP